jgi:hypoxanthine phosphoribosyltransferase
MEFLIPSWEDIYSMCIKLADQIRENGFKPDLIVAVARGGWVPGRIMSDLLSNSNVASLKAEFYKDVAETNRKPIISQGVSAPVEDKRVLVVDDVADTGESLTLVKDYLKKLKATEIRIATLHFKPKSILRPDYFIGETEAWIVYPHERHEFVKNMVRKLRKDGMLLEDVKKEMQRIGLDARLANKFVDESWTIAQ